MLDADALSSCRSVLYDSPAGQLTQHTL